MRIRNRASVWVWAASSLASGGAAFAQATTPSQPLPAPVMGQENTPRPAGGRNQFFSPVMNMEIKGEGVALPAGVAQPEEPLRLPASPAPAAPATPPAAEKPTAK